MAQENKPINQGFSVNDEKIQAFDINNPDVTKDLSSTVSAQNASILVSKGASVALGSLLGGGIGGLLGNELVGWAAGKLYLNDLEKNYSENKQTLSSLEGFQKELSIANGEHVPPKDVTQASKTADFILKAATGEIPTVNNQSMETRDSYTKFDIVRSTKEHLSTSEMFSDFVNDGDVKLDNLEKKDKELYLRALFPENGSKVEAAVDYIQYNRQHDRWNSTNITPEEMQAVHKFDGQIESSINKLQDVLNTDHGSVENLKVKILEMDKEFSEIVKPMEEIMIKHGFESAESKRIRDLPADAPEKQWPSPEELSEYGLKRKAESEKALEESIAKRKAQEPSLNEQLIEQNNAQNIAATEALEAGIELPSIGIPQATPTQNTSNPTASPTPALQQDLEALMSNNPKFVTLPPTAELSSRLESLMEKHAALDIAPENDRRKTLSM